MKIVISKEGCTKNGVSLGEVLMLLAYCNNENLHHAHELLTNKGYIAEKYDNFHPVGWRLTRAGIEVLDSVVIDSERYERSDVDLLNLAGKLKEIFPPGKKEGTSNYWAEGKLLIVKRLKAFFKKYGNDYTDDQIIQAAKKYVEGFNGNYQFMRTLKYFIFKDQEVAGERDYSSDLLNYIENAGQEDTLGNDWNTELV